MRTKFTRREVMVGGAGALALAGGSKRASGQQVKPNIVFVMADDLGYADVSCYGRREYTTANIDRLAQSGMRFLHAYANSAVCSATRTALLTGRYQYRYPIGLEEPLNARSSPRSSILAHGLSSLCVCRKSSKPRPTTLLPHVRYV